MSVGNTIAVHSNVACDTRLQYRERLASTYLRTMNMIRDSTAHCTIIYNLDRSKPQERRTTTKVSEGQMAKDCPELAML
jgi:hypothetical protein